MKKIFCLFLIFVAILFIFSYGRFNDSENSYTPAAPETKANYTYTNKIGQNFSYSTSLSKTVYVKGVSDLIEEWTNNIALAEKTYFDSDILILTEGSIYSINKDFDDTYYISLVDSSQNLNLFGADEINIYFRTQRELNDILNYKEGDYITIICSANDSTNFLGYPKLEAVLVLKPINNVKNDSADTSSPPDSSSSSSPDAEHDPMKSEIMSSLIDDDIDAYIQGGKSLFDWSEAISKYGDDVHFYMEWDVIKYLNGEECEYPERHKKVEQAYYKLQSGELSMP